MMSVIIERAKAKKMLETRSPHDLTVEKLLDDTYFAIDSKRVHPKARVVFGAFMHSVFSCKKCFHYNSLISLGTVVRSEIDWNLSSFDTLRFHAYSIWDSNPGSLLRDIMEGNKCEECGAELPKKPKISPHPPIIGYLERCDKCKK